MNAALKLPKDQVAALRAEDLQLYLTSRGWQPDLAASSPLATVYHYPSEPDAEILVPKRQDIADYAARMADAAFVLAAVEQRSIWQVLSDLALPPADVLRVRMQTPDAVGGTLPLDEGVRLLQGGRDLLYAAAYSAHQPQAYGPRRNCACALKFLQGCRIGPTDRDNYVATLLAPVPPDLNPPSTNGQPDEVALADEPYERRVTLHLMAGLHVIRSALQSNVPGQILEGIRQGVSANLCEALASMSPRSTQGSLEISMSWSRNRPRVPKDLPQRVTFTQGELTIVREAGRRLQDGREPRRERIEGFVIGLRAECQRFADFQGHVLVRAEVEGRAIRVRFVLGREDYARACEAHRAHQRVAVSGVLNRDATRKGFILAQPQGFQVLAANPALYK
jgi:hypothetical protein